MAYPDSKTMAVLNRYESLKNRHNQWTGLWQEVADLVLPHRNFFSPTSSAQRRTLRIFDGTAPWANDQLAAALHGYLTSAAQRFFTLAVDNPDLMKREDVKLWIKDSVDKMFMVFNHPQTQFHQQAHELYLDLGAFGTSVMFVGDEMGQFRFRTYPLAQCYIDESANGIVDTVCRDFSFTARQIFQLFGDKTPPEIARAEVKEPNRVFELAHCVMPRTDRSIARRDQKNMKFASFYIWPEGRQIISEGGFHEMPYKVPRWSKMSGEIYGRSPAITCLPDIKMVNKMSETVIRAGQKAVDPPLLVPDDGFLMPIKTIPGAIIKYRAGTNDRVEALKTNARVDIGNDLMNQRREHILRCFYTELVQNRKTVEQTATEYMGDMEERMRLMAPITARIQSEWLSPTIERVFVLLKRAGIIAPMPDVLVNQNVQIKYVSPLVRAQKMVQAASVNRVIQTLLPLAQMKPQVLDFINEDGFAEWLLDINDAPVEAIQKKSIIKAIREERARQAEEERQQQQGLAQAEMANKMQNVIPMQRQ